MIGQSVTGNRGGVFTVIREVGRGGFGVVYLAEDAASQSYALKLIAPVSDRATQLSFEQEIQSTVGLTHQNLLNIVDYGLCRVGHDQGLFAVSEYCPNGDYRRRIGAYAAGTADIKTVVGEFRQVLTGLSVLHTRIVHRDLKPENVLCSGAVLKIGDFGLAKFVDEATRTLTFKGGGTPRYMAPEVWLAQRATPAADLYAVGVMLFEAATARPPFVANDVNALREMHLYSQAPRAKSLNAALPDSVDGIIRKLLSKEPRDRYQTANEVLDALQAVPVPSRPEVAEIAARMRQHHDAAEAQHIEQERQAQAQRDSAARNRLKEQQVIALIDEVVDEVNLQLAETKIEKVAGHGDREYRFGNRVLVLRFFRPGEMYESPEVPGRMERLRGRHAVHGGYLEIRENGADREGWNLVLVRPPESMYGEWRIVETRVSPLTGRGTQYEPIATNAQLLADNLACHWAPAMHVYVLNDKVLERSDVVKILQAFIPMT
jgi:hypothetical protein